MDKLNLHVTPKGNNWQVKRAGADRASFVTSTQREAEQKAKDFAIRNGGGEIRIHGRDGKIRDSDTVASAKDPNPPRDRKH